MRTLIYVAPVLLSLATGLSAAPAAEANVNTALKDVQAASGRFGGLFKTVQGLVSQVNSVASTVDQDVKTVDTQFVPEYNAYTAASTAPEKAVSIFVTQDCSSGNPACDTGNPAVPPLVAQLKSGTPNSAIDQYVAANKALPTQAEMDQATALVQKAIDGLSASDKAQLNALETKINASGVSVDSAIQRIDGLISQIEQASEPHGTQRK